MKKLMLVIALATVSYGEETTPWTGAIVEASGIYQNDSKSDDNVLVCYEFFRPCKTSEDSSMITDTTRCGGDVPYTIASIHENNPFACTNRQVTTVDSTKLFALLSMPNGWHKKARDTKNYFQSDSLKQKEGWKLNLYGLSEQDKLKLKTKGPVKGMLSTSIYLQGEKCKLCE
jgi:hypothetical protein